MIKLIVFDLDGVLIDSKQNMLISWKKTCLKHNINVPFNNYYNNIGIPFVKILEKLNIFHKHKIIESTYKKESIKNFQCIKFYYDVKNVLLQLNKKGILLSILTSKDRERTIKIASKLNINFNSINSPNKKFRGKPSGDQLLNAISSANVDLNEAIYVGDTNIDHQTAKKAKVKYVHANYGYGNKNISNFLNLNKISDLKKLF